MVPNPQALIFGTLKAEKTPANIIKEIYVTAGALGMAQEAWE